MKVEKLDKYQKLIDEVYCINLEKRTDRLQRMEQQFINLDIDVTKFIAVDGEKTDKLGYQAGVYGCFLSHMNVYTDAIAKQHSTIIILEDDAMIHENFKNTIIETLGSLPANWNICYLGGTNIVSPIPFKKGISKCIETLSTVGYIVQISFIKEMLPFLEKNLKTGQEIDKALTYLQKIHDMFVMSPRIVYQYESYSDIHKCIVNYQHLRDF
jgi:GR25 family glycosyltransferase involved in LPS biosynthesis